MATKSFGWAARVLGLALVAGIAFLPVAASALDADVKCESDKVKTSGMNAKCQAIEYSKAMKKAIAADPVKLGKCSTKFSDKFTKSETKAGAGVCPSEGDAAAIEALLDACVAGVRDDLGGVPGAGGDEAKCQSKKMKEAGKYLDCKTKAASKGIKKALPPDFTKCNSKLADKWGKIEGKPPCGTTMDLASVQAALDACYVDVTQSLTGVPLCGNGTINSGEQCDDGNTMNGDGCSDVCLIEATVEYEQDFEGLFAGSAAALADDGWMVGANVFAGLPPGGAFLYNYFAFPAPNGGPAFSAIATGEGDVPQGAQQLSIYSDYNNGDHGNGNTIEANVFQQLTIDAGDVGKVVTFQFDHKLGNLNDPGDAECPSTQPGFVGTPCANTATAFIKVFDPGFALLDFPTADMTLIPATWGTTSLTTAPIPAGAVGGVLQFGAFSNASLYQPSGIFYDNIIVSSVGGSVCGNGSVEAGETCDDGNLVNGDGCDDMCMIEPVCGNGAVEGAEQCDDGNLINGDGCDDMCNLEPVPGEYTINGDFETGDKTGWTEFLNNGAFTVSMTNPNGGSWSGNLVASVPGGGGPASFPVIKQANIGVGSVVPGGTVTVQFDLNGSLAGAGGVVFAEFFSEISGGGTSKTEIITGAPLFPIAPNDWTAGWVSYSFNLTLGPDVSGGVTLQLKADCGANPGCTVDVFFDNVSVTVP